MCVLEPFPNIRINEDESSMGALKVAVVLILIGTVQRIVDLERKKIIISRFWHHIK